MKSISTYQNINSYSDQSWIERNSDEEYLEGIPPFKAVRRFEGEMDMCAGRGMFIPLVGGCSKIMKTN